MEAVRVKDLSFTYRGASRRALDGIDFSQEAGEFIVLIGRTGAGKSTLCACLNALIPRFQRGEFSGEVMILGESTKGKRVCQMAEKVGMVFQDFESQLFSTNVALEVAFGPENFSLPWKEIAERVEASLKAVGLSGFEGRDPFTLSGGEKQRLAIASVLAMRPRILVLDEPTTDLDPQGKFQILSIIKRLRREGMTVILVEHEIEELREADRIIVLDDGKIVKEGTADEISQDTHFLKNHGVKPPSLAELFQQIGSEEIPSGVDEAEKLWKKKGWRLSSEKYAEIVQGEEKRKGSYGPILIEVRDLEHIYPGGWKALDGINLEVRKGEFVAILGQNGSGKTTLVKHFNGLLKPGKGKVFLEGKDTSQVKIAQCGRRVGYVFQNPDHQIFASTVREEVSFGLKNFHFSEREIFSNVEESLAQVHLQGYEEKDPFSLTKGERQRVAVASVLAFQPEVIVLDEPTTGLDYQEVRDLMELLRDLNSQGQTVIIVTHQMWVAAEYGHRALIMSNGKIILDDAVRKVFSNEERLERLFLRMPQLVKLSNRMGRTLLSVDEFKSCLLRE